VLGKAHATVAADRMRPKMLATARRRVDDVPGDVDVVTIVARVGFRFARRQHKRHHRHQMVAPLDMAPCNLVGRAEPPAGRFGEATARESAC
jgi:hypothetical protein